MILSNLQKQANQLVKLFSPIVEDESSDIVLVSLKKSLEIVSGELSKQNFSIQLVDQHIYGILRAMEEKSQIWESPFGIKLTEFLLAMNEYSKEIK